MYNQSSRVGDECLEQSPANQPTRSNSELLVSQELLRLQREILQGEPPDLGSKQRQRHKSSGRCESPFSEMEDRCRGYVNRPNPSARWLSGAADDLACLQSHQPMYRSFSERAEFRPSVDRNEHRSTMRSFHDDRDLQHHHVFLPTAAKPKRRRLNSNEMMLEMLNDTGGKFQCKFQCIVVGSPSPLSAQIHACSSSDESKHGQRYIESERRERVGSNAPKNACRIVSESIRRKKVCNQPMRVDGNKGLQCSAFFVADEFS